MKKGRTDIFNRLFVGIKKEFKEFQRLSGHIHCWYCGCDVEKVKKSVLNQMTVDHIKPLATGGSRYGFDNLAICCHRCNQRKDDMEVDDFLRWNGFNNAYVLEYMKSSESRYNDKKLHSLFNTLEKLRLKLKMKFTFMFADYDIKEHLWKLTIKGDSPYYVHGNDLTSCLTNGIVLLESLISSNDTKQVNPSNYLVNDYILQLEEETKHLKTVLGLAREDLALERIKTKALMMENDHLRDNVVGLEKKLKSIVMCDDWDWEIENKVERQFEWKYVFKDILADNMKFYQIDNRVNAVIESRKNEAEMLEEGEE